MTDKLVNKMLYFQGAVASQISLLDPAAVLQVGRIDSV